MLLIYSLNSLGALDWLFKGWVIKTYQLNEANISNYLNNLNFFLPIHFMGVTSCSSGVTPNTLPQYYIITLLRY